MKVHKDTTYILNSSFMLICYSQTTHFYNMYHFLLKLSSVYFDRLVERVHPWYFAPKSLKVKLKTISFTTPSISPRIGRAPLTAHKCYVPKVINNLGDDHFRLCIASHVSERIQEKLTTCNVGILKLFSCYAKIIHKTF